MGAIWRTRPLMVVGVVGAALLLVLGVVVSVAFGSDAESAPVVGVSGVSPRPSQAPVQVPTGTTVTLEPGARPATPNAETEAGLVAPPTDGAPAPMPVAQPPAPPAAPGVPADSRTAVRVMTFNIMTGHKKASNLHLPVPQRDVVWSARQPQVVDWVRYTKPDVAGMQENEGISGSDERQSDLLAPLLPEYAWAMADSNLPILYRASAFTLLNSGQFQISFKGKDSSSFDRFTTWAQLRSTVNGTVFFVFNVHTHPYQKANAAKARSASYDVLLQQMNVIDPGLGAPFVMTGDFNARNQETKKVYRDHLTKFSAAGVVDSWSVGPDVSEVKGAASYDGYGIKLDGTWRYHAVRMYDYHYDYVWTKAGTQVLGWQVITGPGLRQLRVGGEDHPFYRDQPLPSDHLPVVADVLLG